MAQANDSENMLNQSSFKTGLPWLFLILGLISLCFGIFGEFDNKNWEEFFKKIGEILLISGLFSFLTTIAQFLGIFKKSIESVIYENKYLEKQKNIDEIWERVTTVLFKSKFPNISKDLLKIIKDAYIPIDQVSYYDDYEIKIFIKRDPLNKDFIIVRNEISFDLYAESTKQFDFPLRNWVCVEGLERDKDYYLNVLEYKVNSKIVTPHKNEEKLINDNSTFFTEHIVKLEGRTKYEISKKIEKKYSLEKDYSICFKAKYIVNKLRIRIECPADIEVTFLQRGTINNFIYEKSTGNILEAKYKGLILPQQGYVLVLKDMANYAN